MTLSSWKLVAVAMYQGVVIAGTLFLLAEHSSQLNAFEIFSLMHNIWMSLTFSYAVFTLQKRQMFYLSFGVPFCHTITCLSMVWDCSSLYFIGKFVGVSVFLLAVTIMRKLASRLLPKPSSKNGEGHSSKLRPTMYQMALWFVSVMALVLNFAISIPAIQVCELVVWFGWLANVCVWWPWFARKLRLAFKGTSVRASSVQLQQQDTAAVAANLRKVRRTKSRLKVSMLVMCVGVSLFTVYFALMNPLWHKNGPNISGCAIRERDEENVIMQLTFILAMAGYIALHANCCITVRIYAMAKRSKKTEPIQRDGDGKQPPW
jgi:hypothetical protein